MSEGLTFPQSPSDGETISFSFQHTGGDANNAVTTKAWSWDGRYNAWISNSSGVTGPDRFVLKTGDTMSGDLITTKAFRTSVDSFGPTEFITKKFFTDNEYRTGTIKHFNLYLTYQTAYDSPDYYEAWVNHNEVRYAKSINDEIGPGVTGFYTINGFSYRSEYHDLTEEKVGFPKPWAVKVKKSFWRSSIQQYLPQSRRDGPRYYPPFGPRPNTDVANEGPSPYVCDSQNFTTEKDIRIRYIGFKSVYNTGGPTGPDTPNSDIVTYMYEPLIGVDFPTEGDDNGFARIKLSTFREGGYPTLGGDTFINEIQIVPG